MEKNKFEEWLINQSNVTIDFQVIPIDLLRAGGASNRFCIIPINRTGAESSTHAIFEVEGDIVKLIQEGQGDFEELEQLDIETNPSQEAIAAIENFEDYLTLYSCDLELRIDTSEKQFYIHPQNKDGATLTFKVQGDTVTPLLLNNHDTTSANKEEATAT